MSDTQTFVLEKAWKATTGRTWHIEFERTEDDADHFYFRFTCTQVEAEGDEEPGSFIYTPQVSKRVIADLGIDAEAKPKLLMRVVAGQGMADLKTRLSAGHDHNFNGLPICKVYSARDAEKLRRFLPS